MAFEISEYIFFIFFTTHLFNYYIVDNEWKILSVHNLKSFEKINSEFFSLLSVTSYKKIRGTKVKNISSNM